MSNRGKLDIAVEILEFCRTPHKLTHILCNSRINQATFRSIITVLLKNELISVFNATREGKLLLSRRESRYYKYYQTTQKGKEFSQVVSKALSLFSEATDSCREFLLTRQEISREASFSA